jgi:outer membrane protein insertion porin family
MSLSMGLFAAVAVPDVGDEPPQTVVEVRVEGNEALSRNAVLSYVKTRAGAAYDENIVKDDRDRMMASGRFATVLATKTHTDKGVIVTFKVAERPAVTRVGVSGNKQFTEEEIRKNLSLLEGDPLNDATIQAGKQAIENQYKAEGFHFVDVSLDDEARRTKREVLYRIVEGPRVVVKKVKFEGNHYFSAFSLKWMRVETKQKLWPFLSGALDNEKIENDRVAIRNGYVAEGFLDAEVGRNIDFSDDKREATVTFLIKEGPRYRINNILFEGNKVFSPEQLAGRMKLRQGKFYTAEELRGDVEAVEFAYGEVGYIEAAVKSRKQFVDPQAPPPDWARDVDGGQPALVNLVYEIVEHDQYKIAAIDVQGNHRTQDRVIRREFRFFPEQLYNTVAVELSKRRLQELRLFKTVAIRPTDPRPSRPGFKDVIVDVEEDETANFMIGLGVSTNSGLLGTVSLSERNFDILNWPKSWDSLVKREAFRGAGQSFFITAEPGTELLRFTVGWSTPYLFDQPYSLGGKAYLFERGREGFDELRLGTQWSLGHRFLNRWYGQMSARLEGIDVNADSDAPREVMDDDGAHTLVGLSGALVRDRTDSRWMPSTGDRFSFSYEQVVGTDTFGKFDASYNIYRTVYVDAQDRKHIVAGRAMFGHIVGDAPVFEKYYGGGIGSIRGFKYRGISPRGHYANGRPHDDPVGGDVSMFLGGEYTFPILSDKIRGVVFLDMGTVEETFTVTTWRASLGAGVRWVIPFMGPVPMSLDFGFPLSKDEDDDTQLVSFSLGWTF